MSCLTPANPDISGIGVRLSVYINAAIGTGGACLLNIFMWRDGKFPRSIKATKRHTKNVVSLLFLNSSALLVSAIVQARSNKAGLSIYHTLIVLNLTWLNSLTGYTVRSLIVRAEDNEGSDDYPGDHKPAWKIYLEKWKALSLADHFDFCLHCTAMSVVGIWFWADPRAFSPPAQRLFSTSQCRPPTFYWLFTRISIPNNHFRVLSLVAYALNIIPILNIRIYAFFPYLTGYLIQKVIPKNLRSICSIAVLAFPSIFLVVITEVLVMINQAYIEHGVEQGWTFGQVFALLTAGVGLLEFRNAIWRVRRTI